MLTTQNIQNPINNAEQLSMQNQSNSFYHFLFSFESDKCLFIL
jgi:hypothetical protein